MKREAVKEGLAGAARSSEATDRTNLRGSEQRRCRIDMIRSSYRAVDRVRGRSIPRSDRVARSLIRSDSRSMSATAEAAKRSAASSSDWSSSVPGLKVDSWEDSHPAYRSTTCRLRRRKRCASSGRNTSGAQHRWKASQVDPLCGKDQVEVDAPAPAANAVSKLLTISFHRSWK